ncbi:MAG: hypothetical protein LAC69_02865 [Chlorobium sp.]|nr:hypothetical protein [Chlorobium sp.]
MGGARTLRSSRRVAPSSLLLLQNAPVDLFCKYRKYRFLEARIVHIAGDDAVVFGVWSDIESFTLCSSVSLLTVGDVRKLDEQAVPKQWRFNGV